MKQRVFVLCCVLILFVSIVIVYDETLAIGSYSEKRVGNSSNIVNMFTTRVGTKMVHQMHLLMLTFLRKYP